MSARLESIPSSRAVTRRPSGEIEAEARKLRDKVKSLADSSHSLNTRRAYQADWRAWESWAASHGAATMPASAGAVAAFLASMVEAGLRVSTIRRRVSALSMAHKLAGLDSPTKDPNVGRVMKGIGRTLGTAPQGRAPLTVEDLRKLSVALPDNLLGIRDRALLLLGFAGALRRSELVALEVGDLAEVAEGIRLTIRRSKTDQEGEGHVLGIPFGSDLSTCPVRAWRSWRHAAKLEAGPAFRPMDRWGKVGRARLSDRAVARIVQRSAALAGLSVERLAGHSLRAGLVTSAAVAGVAEVDIARQSRHRSVAVLRGYVKVASVFRGNAAGKVGL